MIKCCLLVMYTTGYGGIDFLSTAPPSMRYLWLRCGININFIAYQCDARYTQQTANIHSYMLCRSEVILINALCEAVMHHRPIESTILKGMQGWWVEGHNRRAMSYDFIYCVCVLTYLIGFAVDWYSKVEEIRVDECMMDSAGYQSRSFLVQGCIFFS